LPFDTNCQQHRDFPAIASSSNREHCLNLSRKLCRAFAVSHTLPSLGYTLFDVRKKLKSEFQARTGPELATCLEASLAARAASPSESAIRVAFVFPGQGSQWLGMGRSLLREEPAFREASERCDAAIAAEAGWSLVAELQAAPEASRLRDIDVVQPTLFAVEVALAELWHSWGIVPDAVVGHSMGEVAAAHVAGALSLEDATRVICRRSRLLRGISAGARWRSSSRSRRPPGRSPATRTRSPSRSATGRGPPSFRATPGRSRRC
jgi:acyl transferase domain-containing protein